MSLIGKLWQDFNLISIHVTALFSVMSGSSSQFNKVKERVGEGKDVQKRIPSFEKAKQSFELHSDRNSGAGDIKIAHA